LTDWFTVLLKIN